MVDPLAVTPVGLLTVLGLVMTFFAFEIAKPLLRLAGFVSGAITGALVGFLALPMLLGDAIGFGERLVGAVVLGVVGASVGSVVVPLFKRLAIGVAGFVATAASILLVLAGERVLEVVFETVSVSALVEDPVGTLETLAADPVFGTPEIQYAVAAAVILGFVGGGLGLRYYTDVVALAMTAAGAGLLAMVVPIWIGALESGATLEPAATEFSLPVFLVALAVGIAFQVRRHLGELDPRSGDAVVGK